VFPAGAGAGAVTATADFVSRPLVALSMPRLGCGVNSSVFGLSNSSCANPIASPQVADLSLSVISWGGATPGTVELSDDCGGRFGTNSHSAAGLSGSWLPPVNAGLCKLTVRAVNGDGLVEALTAAVLVRAGTPAMSQRPGIFAHLENGCPFGEGSLPECGLIAAGALQSVTTSVGWGDGLPGSVVVTDDCAGVRIEPDNAFFAVSSYRVANQPGQACTVRVRATSLPAPSKRCST
jgi:hypothetical protein